MSEKHRIAILLAEQNGTTRSRPTLADCKKAIMTGDFSPYKYWRDVSENWIEFERFDFFDWVSIVLPSQPSRGMISTAAYAAFVANGEKLDDYDGFIVVLNTDQVADAGTWAIRTKMENGKEVAIDQRLCATVHTTSDYTFIYHEVGHVLGFSHSFGISNLGSDWDGPANGLKYSNEYGDPYDIMSSANFGDASPSFAPNRAAIPGFPNLFTSVGPSLSRASLHFHKPLALESRLKVRHIEDLRISQSCRLYSAGTTYDNDGDKTLIAIHAPGNAAAEKHGWVYVELRNAETTDTGLEVVGDARDRVGIVIHSIRNIDGAYRVFYEGRIAIPSNDADITVTLPEQTVNISVEKEIMKYKNSSIVNVTVSRQAKAKISLDQQETFSKRVTRTEQRQGPLGLSFNWEFREVTETQTDIPIAYGLGGVGDFDNANNRVTFTWEIEGQKLSQTVGVASITLAQGRVVRVQYSVNASDNSLTVTNTPQDGSYTVSITVTARDAQNNEAKQKTQFIVNGIEEDWDESYYAFLSWYKKFINPIPRPRIGVRIPPVLRYNLDDIKREFERIRALNPDLASTLRPTLDEAVRHLRLAPPR